MVQSKNYSFFIIILVLSFLFISSFALADGGRYVVGGDVNCVQSGVQNDIYSPGRIGGGTKDVSWRMGLTEQIGVPLGPTVTLDASSLQISPDYQKIQVKINGLWYAADPYGYVKVPGETEAKILSLNPDDKTGTMIFNNFADHCINDSLLLKYDCAAQGYQKEIPCPNGCSEGACIPDIKSSSSGLLNIDYGSWAEFPSQEVGAAVVGGAQDYWNVVVEAWNDDITKGNLKYADKATSPISVRSVNLGGSWSNAGIPSLKDSMLNTYSYPQNNQGGDSKVILTKIPQGTFDLYIYGYSIGDYEVNADGVNYGRRITIPISEAKTSTIWTEGFQYVKFSNINVASGEINIHIRPGGAPFYDTLISGLQLIPSSGQSSTTIEVSEDVTCKFSNNSVISHCFAYDGQMCEANKANSCTINVKSSSASLQWGSNCLGGGIIQMDGAAKTLEFNCTGAQATTMDKSGYGSYGQSTTTNTVVQNQTNPVTMRTPALQTDVVNTPIEQMNTNLSDANVNETNLNDPNLRDVNTAETNSNNQQTNQTNLETTRVSTTVAEPNAIACKDSCAYNGKCYPLGYRRDGKFCSDTTFFTDQIVQNNNCQNNFECTSNLCVSGKCISSSLIDQIIAWFKVVFG
ncbi:MAG: hypothetical protein WCI04_02295 [archaeon]